MTTLAILEEEIVTTLLWEDRLPQQIVGDTLSAKDRFAVHQNTVITTLRHALSHTYPVVQQLVGDDFFIHMAQSFIRSYPPHSPVLLDYGGTFPVFIEHFAAARTLPYLSDVARLEWAMHRAHHAADARKIDQQTLSSAAADDMADLVFMPHPATQLIHSEFPVYDIWLAHQDEIDHDIALSSEACWLLIGRPELEVTCWQHSAAEYAVLHALIQGDPLGKAVDAGLDVDQTLALDSLLAACIVRGYFTGITTVSPSS